MPERLQTHELEKLPGLWSEVVKSFIKLLGKNKSLTSDAVSRVLRDHEIPCEITFNTSLTQALGFTCKLS